MRPEELLDAMEHIDAKLIIEADTTPKRNPTHNWVAAVAAMLAFIITLSIVLIRPRDTANPLLDHSHSKTPTATSTCSCLPSSTCLPFTPPTLPNSFMVPLADYTKQPESVSLTHSFVDNTGSSSGEPTPGLYFRTYGLVVQARVKQILPDLYMRFGMKTPCYVLVMETLDAMNVDQMPEEFYYLLPSTMGEDLDRFDCLILSMQQEGIENYLLINQTTAKYETFDKMFESFFAPDDGSVIAFTDGKIDMTLWDLHNWCPWYSNWEREFDQIEQGTYSFFFPGGRNASLDECKEAIRQEIATEEASQHKKVYCQADFDMEELFARIAPFENGVFEHYLLGKNLYFCQTVNGIRTNFGLKIMGKEILSSLPDLEIAIDILTANLYEVAPSEPGYSVVSAWAEAEYYMQKDSNEIYGIIKLNWKFRKDGRLDEAIVARYYLVTSDGTCRAATYEEIDRIKNPHSYD